MVLTSIIKQVSIDNCKEVTGHLSGAIIIVTVKLYNTEITVAELGAPA